MSKAGIGVLKSAKLLIDKGIITEAELRAKIAECIISGTTTCASKNGGRRLTARVSSQYSTLVSSKLSG